MKCLETCDTDQTDCYIIDNNGYIILSENSNDTGRFFGEIEGAVLKEMVDWEVFQEVKVYDLQGLCSVVRQESSSGISIKNVRKFYLKIF